MHSINKKNDWQFSLYQASPSDSGNSVLKCDPSSAENLSGSILYLPALEEALGTGCKVSRADNKRSSLNDEMRFLKNVDDAMNEKAWFLGRRRQVFWLRLREGVALFSHCGLRLDYRKIEASLEVSKFWSLEVSKRSLETLMCFSWSATFIWNHCSMADFIVNGFMYFNMEWRVSFVSIKQNVYCLRYSPKSWLACNKV